MISVGLLLVLATNGGDMYILPSTLSKSASLQLFKIRTPAHSYKYGYGNQYSTLNSARNTQQHITNLISHTAQQHVDYNHLRQPQGWPHQLYPSNNPLAGYRTVPETTQQQLQSYNNFKHHQLPGIYQPAVYQTVQATTQTQQSYDNANNYITSQYGHNNVNVAHLLPSQTTQEPVDDKVSGIGINEVFGTEYDNHESQPAASVVTKHIYFHVPPADIDEQVAPAPGPSRPSKSVYNIIFIKAPDQEAENAVQLQQILTNQQNPVEDKTLIYIFVEKSEPQSVPQVPVTPVNSQHEVFYVKYKGDVSKGAALMKDQLHVDGGATVRVADNVHSSGLQPGLVNGHK